MKRIGKIAMTLLFMVALGSLTACNPEEDPVSPETGTQTPGPAPGTNPDGSNDPNDDNNNPEQPVSRNIRIKIGDSSFAATLEDNEAGNAFAALLPLTITMTEMNGNEKYYYLSNNLPTEGYRPGTIRNGDLMLYGSNCVVLFYETFTSSYSYTRLGKVTNPEGLAATLGRGDATVTFEINNN